MMPAGWSLQPLTPKDRARVAEISLGIWDDDYVPRVFDSWLEDGGFEGLFVDGILVAFAKLSVIAPGQAWLEGLRKDSRCGFKGVGRIIGEEFLARIAGDPGIASIRFSTYVDNAQSIALNEKLGYRRVDARSIRCLELSDSQAPCDPLPIAARRPREDEFPRVLDFAERSAYHGRWLCRGWRVEDWNLARFESLFLRRGLCRIIDAGAGIEGCMALEPDPEYGYAKIAFCDATGEEGFRSLLDNAREEAREGGMDYLEAMLPSDERIKEGFSFAGFHGWERDDDFLIYELPPERRADFVR